LGAAFRELFKSADMRMDGVIALKEFTKKE
jgi:hypothetical protein